MFERYSYRYLPWDDTQQVDPFSADDLMDAMADDLIEDGDLRRTLRDLYRRGDRGALDNRLSGLREMMERLRRMRQEQLERHDLNSIMDDIGARLDDILQTERGGIDRRLQEAGLTPPEGQPSPQAPAERDDASSEGAQGSSDADTGRPRAESPRQSDQVSAASTRQPRPDDDALSGQQQGASGEQTPGDSEAGEQTTGAGDENAALRKMLQTMADRKRDQLDALPDDVPGRLKGLSDYDFMDPEARQKYDELMAMLQQQVMQSYFQGMQQALQTMTPEDLARTREMVRDLNTMLEDRMQGREPRFNEFMDKYGEMFPGVQNLDDLLEQLAARMGAMNSLMQSMSPEMRQQLQEMMEGIIGDDRLRADLMRLAANLSQMMPSQGMEGRPYPFSGDQPLTLMEAMAMMERLEGLNDLEGQLQAAQNGMGIEEIDPNRVRDLMDAETAAQLERLQNITKMLEEAGYIQRRDDEWELTPRAMRKIAQKALRDVFSSMKRDSFGQHESEHRGGGGERIDETKPYDFGDPFLMDIKGTMMNALARNGAGTPVRMKSSDFEVYRTELLTQSATVLMLDKSSSMSHDDRFIASKKVALALDALIRGQYPRDKLFLVKFSRYAQQIQPTDLARETLNDYGQGTNFHHGLMLARQLLSRSKAVNKQIIIITDGAPTAHLLPSGEAYFDYPTSRECLEVTMREVLRATRDGIRINTFLLESDEWLAGFVDKMTDVNKGRAFYASPDRLGEYILVDYVRNKRAMVS